MSTITHEPPLGRRHGHGAGLVLALASALAFAGPCGAAEAPAGATFHLGSPASAEELKAFVSPLADGRGLPPGSGSVEQGRGLYQAQCLACHGDKLQGGLGDRLIGGRGTLVNSDPKKPPMKTVESYWPYATTLFDYIKRAMPLNAPASLSNDEVYALCAYILAEAAIVPQDAVLNERSLPQVRMPNRDGFVPDRRPDKFKPAAGLR